MTAALVFTSHTGGHAEVHINDIWLRRSPTAAGVFRADWEAEHHYDRFKEAFLQCADHGLHDTTTTGYSRRTATSIVKGKSARHSGSWSEPSPTFPPWRQSAFERGCRHSPRTRRSTSNYRSPSVG